MYPQPLFSGAGGGYPVLYIHKYSKINDSMQSFLLDGDSPDARSHFFQSNPRCSEAQVVTACIYVFFLATFYISSHIH